VNNSPNPARAELAELCRVHGYSEIARRCGLGFGAVRRHAVGIDGPSSDAKAAYQRALGIDADAWPTIKRGRPLKSLACPGPNAEASP